jgi:hypothetical protein
MRAKPELDSAEPTRRVVLAKTSPNTYEAPGCQEANESCERNLLHFFMLAMPAFGSVS